MIKDLLRKFTTKPGSAAPAATTTSSSATPPKMAAKSGNRNIQQAPPPVSKTRDRLVFLLLTCVVIGGYTMLQIASEPDPNAQNGSESVIPLSQLTGKIGVQPKQETPEQQFRREIRNVPFSDGSALTPEEVSKRTQLFRQVPFGDKELTYEMRLPVNWGQSRFSQYGTPGENRYKVLTNIDRFFGPAIEDKRPFVWMEVEVLTRMTTAENYMNQYLIQRGLNAEASKIHGMNRAEALYIQARDYNSFVQRTLFVINGDRVMLVTFAVPIEAYSTYKDLIGLTFSSFRMLDPIERKPEAIAAYKLLNVLTFDYPARWRTRNENRTSSLRPSVELVLPTELDVPTINGVTDNQIDGLILVNAWRKTPTFSRATLEETIVKRLQQNQVKFTDILIPEKILPTKAGISDMRQTVYIAQIDRTEATTEEFGVIRNTSASPRQEIWVTVFDNGDYLAAVTLVTWPQTKNYYNWSYNVASYQEVLESLRLRLSVY